MAVRSLRAGELPAAPMASRSADWLRLLAIGGVAGLLSGLFGTGGGSVLVPGMVCLLGVDQVAAQGISLAVIVPTAAVGAITHQRLGNVDLGAMSALAPLGVTGGAAGALVAGQLDPALLR